MSGSLNIKDAETSALAREVARDSGRTITQTVKDALKAERQKVRQTNDSTFFEDIMAIARRMASYPVTDDREPDDMLYDENGLPK